MEEQRKIGIFRLCGRLLRRTFCAAAWLFLAAKLFPQGSGRIPALSFFLAEEKIYAGTEFSLELDIPSVPPDEVSAALPLLPDGFEFVSLTQERRADGTGVSLRLVCSEAGRFAIPSVPVTIRGCVLDVPVPVLEVKRNLDALLPEIVVTLEDGREFSASGNDFAPVLEVACGTPVLFTVSLRYASHLVDFSWTAPRAALLEERRRYAAAGPYAVSDEAAPVAEFSWIPLEEGAQPFPEMRLVAFSFGGIRSQAVAPEISAFVLPSEDAAGIPMAASDEDSERADAFSFAFVRNEAPAHSFAVHSVSIEECERLADLRRSERKALPFAPVRKERAALEGALGLSECPDEPTFFLLVLFLAASAAFLFAAAAAFVRRRAFFAPLVLALAMAVLAAVWGCRLRERHGIFCGGTVSAVPEESAPASVLVEAGRRVLIVRKVGGWTLLRAEGGFGWTSSERILEI